MYFTSKSTSLVLSNSQIAKQGILCTTFEQGFRDIEYTWKVMKIKVDLKRVKNAYVFHIKGWSLARLILVHRVVTILLISNGSVTHLPLRDLTISKIFFRNKLYLLGGDQLSYQPKDINHQLPQLVCDNLCSLIELINSSQKQREKTVCTISSAF